MPKRTLPIVLLILGLMGGIAPTGIYVGKKLSRPQKEPLTPPSTQPEEIAPKITPTESSKIDISNWEIYKNEKYGFEVRYPKKYLIREIKGIPREKADLGIAAFEDLITIIGRDKPIAMIRIMKLLGESTEDWGTGTFDTLDGVLRMAPGIFPKCLTTEFGDIRQNFYEIRLIKLGWVYTLQCNQIDQNEKICDWIFTTFQFIGSED